MSRLIKSCRANHVQEENKVISIKVLRQSENKNGQAAFVSLDFEKKEILEQAHREAELIISQANLQAEMIRRQLENEKLAWEQERRSQSDQAKQEGHEAGLIEGRKQGYKEYREAIGFAKDVINSARNDYRMTIEASDKTILDLALKVSGKILGKKIAEQEEYFFHLVKRALKEAREYREIQLHVHPAHYDFLLAQKDELLSIFPRETDLYIYPDEDLSKQSCMIESASGRIDASVDSQLEQIKQKLFELLESEA